MTKLSLLVRELTALFQSRETLTLAQAIQHTGVKRFTLKEKLNELIDAGMIELR